MAGEDDHDWHTRLSHAGRAGKRVAGFVNPPVQRGSTALFPTLHDLHVSDGGRLEQVFGYGLRGAETHWRLEDVIAGIEGGSRSQIVSTGLAAITTPLLAYLNAGDHMLMTEAVYGPGRRFADRVLRRMGIEVGYYEPTIDAGGLRALLRPNTTVLYLESPGSHTFEVQDVPALAAVAHAHGAKVLMDNTWGIHFFQPFKHGVDVSIQALTKYVCGHSDVLLGSITTNSAEDWERVRTTALALGQYASPDDCWLALRGARTLAVRLDRQQASGLEVAHWLASRPEVARVLHPAFPSCPGHDFWKRDFSGACSLFSVVIRPEFSHAAVGAMAEALDLFGIGASWGGYESLVVPSVGEISRTLRSSLFNGSLVRFHIGLEEPADLIADLERGFAVMRATNR